MGATLLKERHDAIHISRYWYASCSEAQLYYIFAADPLGWFSTDDESADRTPIRIFDHIANQQPGILWKSELLQLWVRQDAVKQSCYCHERSLSRMDRDLVDI